MNIYQKLAVATAVPTLTFAAIPAIVQAATITYDFKADVTSSSFADQSFTGVLSYDDSALVGVGPEFLAPADGLKVSFNFLHVTYTEKDDVNSPDFPITNFNNGVFEGLDFFVNDAPKVFAINLNKFSYRGEQVGTITYTKSEPVPEPETILGLAILSMGGLFLKKKYL